MIVRPGNSKVPCVVAQPVVLFVRAVVLLVNDDCAGVRQRGKNGRAGADDHQRTAVGGGFPYIQALWVGKPGVQGHHRHAKTAFEPRQRLRCKANFGHEHQGLLSFGSERFDEL